MTSLPAGLQATLPLAGIPVWLLLLLRKVPLLIKLPNFPVAAVLHTLHHQRRDRQGGQIAGRQLAAHCSRARAAACPSRQLPALGTAHRQGVGPRPGWRTGCIIRNSAAHGQSPHPSSPQRAAAARPTHVEAAANRGAWRRGGIDDSQYLILCLRGFVSLQQLAAALHSSGRAGTGGRWRHWQGAAAAVDRADLPWGRFLNSELAALWTQSADADFDLRAQNHVRPCFRGLGGRQGLVRGAACGLLPHMCPRAAAPPGTRAAG